MLTDEQRAQALEYVRNGMSFSRAAGLTNSTYSAVRAHCRRNGVQAVRSRSGVQTPPDHQAGVRKVEMAHNEAWLTAWKAGDQEAFNQLYRATEGLRVSARKRYGGGLDRDDCDSLINSAFLDAAQRWRPDAGTVFTTYFMLVCHSFFTRHRAALGADKRRPKGKLFSMSPDDTRRWGGLLDRGTPNPAVEVERAEEHRRQVRRARRLMRRLTERERAITIGRSQDRSLYDLADEIGLSPERIRQIHYEALRILKMTSREFRVYRDTREANRIKSKTDVAALAFSRSRKLARELASAGSEVVRAGA